MNGKSFEEMSRMEITKLAEHGYEESAIGFSLSYNSTSTRAKEIFPKYAWGKRGESKFLESIYLWLDINAPRFWWSEADTYRMSSKQSSSTMHTLAKTELTNNNFEYPIDEDYLKILNDLRLKTLKGEIKIEILKNALPEGFLQRRIWVMNYKCLQNIYIQRCNHRLPQWKYFCNEIVKIVDHPEFIIMPKEKENQNIM